MVAKSDSIKELATALAKAQAEIKGASKDSANPYFKSKYADLASVWDACRGSLTKYGLAVSQFPSADGAKVTVDTILMHESGEWIQSQLTMTAKEDSPQAIGSVTTYARRYSLAAAVGVAPEDDDGEAAEGRGGAKSAGRPATEENTRLTKTQKDSYQALVNLIKSAQDDAQVDAAAQCCLDDCKHGKITAGQLDLLKSVGRQKRESLKAMDQLDKRLGEAPQEPAIHY